MTNIIVILFLFGYFLITMENKFKISKTAIALLLGVLCWALYMTTCSTYIETQHTADYTAWQHQFATNEIPSASTYVVNKLFLSHIGDIAEILFFLMGAMTIVEVVDYNGGFDFVRERLYTKNMKTLLWRISFMTFFLSAILDNLTTSIIIIMILRKLIHNHETRMLYAGIIILAANAGGAFSPIGDVTTIMLWIKGNITSNGIIKALFLPSVLSIVIPILFIQHKLKKDTTEITNDKLKTLDAPIPFFSPTERKLIFYVGVFGLILVPVFRNLTNLPPVMGVLFILSILWILTEIFYRRHKEFIKNSPSYRVSDVLHHIDLSTILFFLGILMAVAAIEETGALRTFGNYLVNVTHNNSYLVTGTIGLASSVIDNVPLVASGIGMYHTVSIAQVAANPELQNFMVDGTFWQLLTFCAGTGGSILIIGSAAGVVVMGMEHISFGWYLKNISLLALSGFITGMICYWLEKTYIFC